MMAEAFFFFVFAYTRSYGYDLNGLEFSGGERIACVSLLYIQIVVVLSRTLVRAMVCLDGQSWWTCIAL